MILDSTPTVKQNFIDQFYWPVRIAEYPNNREAALEAAKERFKEQNGCCIDISLRTVERSMRRR